MSLIVKRVDAVDTVAQQAVHFDIDGLFEQPGFYFPIAEPGGQYRSCPAFQRGQCYKGMFHINNCTLFCLLFIFLHCNNIPTRFVVLTVMLIDKL
jgi:hypothetical protein